ncbi:hypothetical protein [Curtobacterium sp. MCSS17_015]|uniref:hypothetical protein n=1 Tax=Curtobacterium sp. MCSS17_015 TaxID=2175666 RepID=UPI0011B71BB0|nr:hypothetical protein [Curtobacterium sp. MCSS17_015]WIB27875.1 hypothetical protein DEJ18_07245 [Curtobacterium sp. MCSS17_015]
MGEAFAFATQAELTHSEARLLAYMALTALDTPNPERGVPARRYFGGREDAAYGLGKIVPPEPDDGAGDAAEIQRQRRNIFESVNTATRVLVSKGALRVVTFGREGRRSEYELTMRVRS